MRLNSMESFFASEMAVWHGYLRQKDNISVSVATAIQFDNEPYQDESRLPASESMDPSPGASNNITVTKSITAGGGLISSVVMTAAT